MTTAKAKLNALQKQLEKKFGANVIRPAKEVVPYTNKRIPTGSIGLDIALNGGYPLGRFIQIRGHFSASKSSFAYHGAREFQKFFADMKQDLYVALIQGENGSFTPEYAEQIGIDTDRLIVNECASMEEALEVAVQLQKEQVAGLVIFDSFASFVPMKEQDSAMEDSVQMGLKPKLFDEYCRKFQAMNNKLVREGQMPCTIIGLNQIREKIGAYGDPEYSPGGRSLDFTSSLNINLRRGEWITVGTGANKQIIGQQVKFKISKSKVSVPYLTGDWDFYIDEGGVVPQGHIDNFKEVVLESVAYGIVERGGAWFSYKDLKVQGADNLVAELRNNLELYEEIKEATLKVALEKADDDFNNFKEENSDKEETGVEPKKAPKKAKKK